MVEVAVSKETETREINYFHKVTISSLHGGEEDEWEGKSRYSDPSCRQIPSATLGEEINWCLRTKIFLRSKQKS